MTISLIRTVIAMIPAILLAIPLYAFNLFELGFILIFFFANLLISGWILGIFVIAGILRFGVSAESLAWLGIFILAPLSAIYYPVSVIPEWLRWLSLSLPQTYIFEGMREILFNSVIRSDYMLKAVIFNVIFMFIGIVIFLIAFEGARKRGALLNIGE